MHLQGPIFRYIQNKEGGNSAAITNADYQVILSRYQLWKKEYDEVMDDYTVAKRECDKDSAAFRINSSASNLARNFKIILKDDRDGRKESFHYEGGIVEFVREINKNKDELHKPIYFKKQMDGEVSRAVVGQLVKKARSSDPIR